MCATGTLTRSFGTLLSTRQVKSDFITLMQKSDCNARGMQYVRALIFSAATTCSHNGVALIWVPWLAPSYRYLLRSLA